MARHRGQPAAVQAAAVQAAVAEPDLPLAGAAAAAPLRSALGMIGAGPPSPP